MAHLLDVGGAAAERFPPLFDLSAEFGDLLTEIGRQRW
jgi:hypothetical protein